MRSNRGRTFWDFLAETDDFIVYLIVYLLCVALLGIVCAALYAAARIAEAVVR